MRAGIDLQHQGSAGGETLWIRSARRAVKGRTPHGEIEEGGTTARGRTRERREVRSKGTAIGCTAVRTFPYWFSVLPLPPSVADDESRHLGWCLQRMAELGCAYGDMDAHDLLWQGCSLSSGDVAARLVYTWLIHRKGRHASEAYDLLWHGAACPEGTW